MGAVEGDCVQTGKTIYQDGRTWNLVTGGTSRIDELKSGVEQFYEAIREDEVAVYSAEICVVTFNDMATCVMDFANVERQEDFPELIATGDTAMGEGGNLALDLLEKRKQEYRDKGVDYYQPWLVLMTDGEPNGFSPKRPALKLQGLKFREFFAWLSQSVSRVLQFTPEEEVKLVDGGIEVGCVVI